MKLDVNYGRDALPRKVYAVKADVERRAKIADAAAHTGGYSHGDVDPLRWISR